jgi:S-adenosyl-L-methionine hydrolase (adenosine-forming)
MPIVTLTTDFGTKDYYVAILKGAMLGHCDTLTIVDVSHHIKTFDIVQGAFTIKSAYTHFPKGTIHVVGVNNCYAEEVRFLAIKYRDYYFIGPDNGVFSLIMEQVPQAIYLLPKEEDNPIFSFKTIFAKAVGHLANGFPIETIGTPVADFTKRISIHPVTTPLRIRGTIIHIDNYENAITNIHQTLFERIADGREMRLFFKRNDPITCLCEQYSEVAVGENLCLFNSSHYLEIAINMGKAASMLGLSEGDTVEVEFY